MDRNEKNRSGWILTMDPRHKVFIAFTFSLVVSLSHHPFTLYSANLLALLLVSFSYSRIRPILKGFYPVLPFLLICWTILPLTTADSEHLPFLFLKLSHKGLLLAETITLKCLAILSVFMVFVGSISIPTLTKVLCFFKVPSKLVFLFMVTYRYIEVIGSERQRLMTAARIRGFSPKTSLYTYRVYAYMIAMIFLKAYLRSKRVHEAMKLRGFCGSFPSLQVIGPLFEKKGGLALIGCATLGLFILELYLTRLPVT